MTDVRPGLADFNDLSAEDAQALLATVLDNAGWQRVLAAGRPFLTLRELAAMSDGVIAALAWSDVHDAVDAAGESAAVAGSEDAAAYRTRFAIPFLVEPTGRTSEEIHALLVERLAHDDGAEQQVVRRELAALVRTRLAKAFG